MTIQVGESLPQVTFRIMTADGPVAKTTDDLFKGRNVVLVAVPGAFTPTCHRNHLPGYVENQQAIKAKGVDAIVVTAVNDVFVMDAWSRQPAATASNSSPMEMAILPVRSASAWMVRASASAPAHSAIPWWWRTVS